MQKIFILILIPFFFNCCQKKESEKKELPDKNDKVSVIFDTDTNNELDDQHALAYLLFNQDVFDVIGVTVNATRNGGNIDRHFEEAVRVMKLTKNNQEIPLLKGADADYESIKNDISNSEFDGQEAVDFIIDESNKMNQDTLTIIAVGKLTNVALAYAKAPEIINKTRLVWLGSNYPESGEYNLINDTTALQYLIRQEIPFEMVMVRYGKPTGSAAVRVLLDEILEKMPGKGPQLEEPVVGRHGGEFYNFGDYSINLFENVKFFNDPPFQSII